MQGAPAGAAALDALHEPRFFEHPHVLARPGQRDPELLGDRGDRRFAARAEQLDQPPAPRVGERVEGPVEVRSLRLLRLNHVVYYTTKLNWLVHFFDLEGFSSLDPSRGGGGRARGRPRRPLGLRACGS